MAAASDGLPGFRGSVGGLIFLAVKHKPREVERVQRQTSTSSGVSTKTLG